MVSNPQDATTSREEIMKSESRAAALSNVPLEQRAWNIRRKALLMGEVQGQGYIGQALGVADVLAASYFHALE
ncbi:MAG TPA: hypothetical protein PLL33_06495 [Paracoccus sp. (in: a-proteobacteria)]|nr:hypothetical protein [Paracoccus sp. (in: a-proteobacteria)]